MTIEWRGIPGWEGLYSVSDSGLVRSDRRQIVLSPMWMGRKSKQYAAVALYRGGTRQCYKVHALVLLAFVGPRPDGLKGCHRDDDPKNNTLPNLYWGTQADNQRDIVMNGRSSQHKLSHEQRMLIRARRAAGESCAALGREFGVSGCHVSSIATGRVKTVAVGEPI